MPADSPHGWGSSDSPCRYRAKPGCSRRLSVAYRAWDGLRGSAQRGVRRVRPPCAVCARRVPGAVCPVPCAPEAHIGEAGAAVASPLVRLLRQGHRAERKRVVQLRIGCGIGPTCPMRAPAAHASVLHPAARPECAPAAQGGEPATRTGGETTEPARTRIGQDCRWRKGMPQVRPIRVQECHGAVARGAVACWHVVAGIRDGLHPRGRWLDHRPRVSSSGARKPPYQGRLPVCRPKRSATGRRPFTSALHIGPSHGPSNRRPHRAEGLLTYKRRSAKVRGAVAATGTIRP